MSKKCVIAIISAVSACVIIAISIIMAIYIPRRGEPYYSYWSPYDELGDKSDTEIVNLEKKADRDFVILQLPDIQMGKYDKTAKETFEIITKLVNENKPDLIVMTGDNVCGNFAYSVNKKLVDFIDGFGIPWAALFGNHDDEYASVDKYYLAEQFMASENSLFKYGPSNIKGVGNYVINIVEGNKPIYSMHMLDSNSADFNIGGAPPYDYIGYDQIQYFEWYSKKLNARYGVQIPVMSFFHIPPVELLEEYNRLLELSGNGTGKLMVPSELGTGGFASKPQPSTINSGYVEMAKRINLTHMFFGHDHSNDASINIDGITMTYGLKTGNASHSEGTPIGGTIIKVSGDRPIEIQHKII